MTLNGDTSIFDACVHREISRMCLAGSEDKSRKIICCDKIRPDANIALWKYIDIDDYSLSRFFVVPLIVFDDCLAIYEVDFLSRNEILSPIKPEATPDQWSEWGVARGSNMFVFDREVFIKSLLTFDMFLALPKHRFENLADDVCAQKNFSGNVTQDVFDILSARSSGYSFLLYIKPGTAYDACILYVMHSCLEGKKYENSDMCRLALEQLQLRTG